MHSVAMAIVVETCTYEVASFPGSPEGCDTSGNLVRSGRNQLEIIGNQLEITEIWLEIRNQKSGNQREITRNTPFLSEHAQ